MKSILLSNYNNNLGLLIDVRDPLSYKDNHISGSINIYYDKLLLNHKILLDKNKAYFLICDKGKRSKQATRILDFYGYNVTYVINE